MNRKKHIFFSSLLEKSELPAITFFVLCANLVIYIFIFALIGLAVSGLEKLVGISRGSLLGFSLLVVVVSISFFVIYRLLDKYID